jgi:hypothetical protein
MKILTPIQKSDSGEKRGCIQIVTTRETINVIAEIIAFSASPIIITH